MLLRGEIQHKDLWLIDLDTGAERQLTNLAPDFDIRDFDILQTAVKLSWNERRNVLTWCFWISPGHNPV